METADRTPSFSTRCSCCSYSIDYREPGVPQVDTVPGASPNISEPTGCNLDAKAEVRPESRYILNGLALNATGQWLIPFSDKNPGSRRYRKYQFQIGRPNAISWYAGHSAAKLFSFNLRVLKLPVKCAWVRHAVSLTAV